MKDPYNLFNISQNASNQEIKKAQMQAMKSKTIPAKDIANAARQLLNPAKRLAADFIFPARIKAKRPKKFPINIKFTPIDISELDENAYNSL